MSLLVKPIISEKSMDQVTKNKYVFVVAEWANKNQIKKLIEDKFKVKIVSISTVTTKGKTKRVGMRRNEVPVSAVKKAIVQIKDGQKIAIFDTNG